MFEVEKTALVNAQRVISKVIKDLNVIYLLASPKDKSLWLIANEPTHYLKILIPEAKVTEKGLVGLKADIFASTLSMRGNTYKAEYNKEDSKLDITCGSKNSVYVLDVTKESIARDKEEKDYIDISSKKVAFMREMFKGFTFSTPDAGFSGSALFKNTKEGMSVLFATVNTCAYYETNTPIAKTEFEVTVPMTMVMDILSIITSEAKISITENSFSIDSDTVEATIPTVEDETKGYTEFYNTLKGKKVFMDGKVTLSPKKILPMLNSVRTTSSGADLVKLVVKDTKGKMTISSKNGVASDKFPIEKNSIGDFDVDIPEAYLNSTLNIAGHVAEEVGFYLAEEKNLYKLMAKNDAYDFMTVGPISN